MKGIFLAFIISFNVVAGCNPSSIQETPNGFMYPPECHQRFGQLVVESRELKKENEELRKSLDFKQLAINEANIRADQYYKVAVDNTERMQNMSDSNGMTRNLVFIGGVGIGIGLTGVAAMILKGVAR